MKQYDTIIVGGGISGLTASAFLAQADKSILLIEQADKVGGLVSTFKVGDYTFDGGIRAIENSGIVFPMLKQLGLEVEFLQSTVSLGIGDEVIQIADQSSLDDYASILIHKFPHNEQDIKNIMTEIHKIMHYMRILYGIDNPIFLDVKEDREYFIKRVIPWMFDYLFTYKKVQKRSVPVEDYLRQFTTNQALIDVIGQHFFKDTPAFFALSYFSLYLDYRYPKGGTGTLVHTIEDDILKHHGEIKINTAVVSVDPIRKIVTDQNGESYSYKTLIWSANLTTLYDILVLDQIPPKAKQLILQKRKSFQGLRGGDSVLTAYISVHLPPRYFEEKCTAHFFYTPKLDGLHDLLREEKQILQSTNQTEIFDWIARFFEKTTYEISIPVLRDPDMAPQGKTGLIVSTLFSYDVTKHILELGFYGAFKTSIQSLMIKNLDQSVFPGLADYIESSFSSTPITLQQRTGNIDGAITGWAFTNHHMPAVDELIKVAQSVLTPIPDVYQYGQWTYSPAGLPISILTGKLAANKVLKRLRKIK